jgi:hypothetical protein
VTESIAGPDDMGPLRALGQAGPPGPGVLEAAREALWSAVAGEMLSAEPDGGSRRAGPARTDELPDGVQRRWPDPGW